ncbi:hypothetical protein AtNW77_Chr4g0282811 [Arabidopsis thaliana]|uniref:Uncharacterized protein n=3 Tax=Arabidopsis TaxID=3701 RepID=Q1PEA4_ARATH|nr:uncharacterized protein AT4G09850 [Arabidopsis thaliana]ABE66052.1 unknown [Arabidopsis thaliana]AEE82806.1 hypothetical protein AT4G09850 [Arabidopsis thaliana]KAG7615423.1 hypothetical protein ISN45_At04g009810 [Arabidopsis thaliana x Arabidopsis arenosa]KAG7619920.1 hypothetical protein ISN44_As04g009420 [Arabidopsis suecica]|eukprot:NP_192723.2 hypothetical protein AT4G09850 [Arabidopsis thaliana]
MYLHRLNHKVKVVVSILKPMMISVRINIYSNQIFFISTSKSQFLLSPIKPFSRINP